jgi:hypothetical protein
MEDVDMFGDVAFSDFDIENEGASSTPMNKGKGAAAKKPAKTAAAKAGAKTAAAKKTTTAPKTAAGKAAGAGVKKATAGKGRGKGKGKAAAAAAQDDGDDTTMLHADASAMSAVGAAAADGTTIAAATNPGDNDDDDDEDGDPHTKIPPQLLTRIVHGFFARPGTRMTKAANEAVARYVEVFAREAVARAAVGKRGGFLEVEDLEKVGPQLLLDM